METNKHLKGTIDCLSVRKSVSKSIPWDVGRGANKDIGNLSTDDPIDPRLIKKYLWRGMMHIGAISLFCAIFAELNAVQKNTAHICDFVCANYCAAQILPQNKAQIFADCK